MAKLLDKEGISVDHQRLTFVGMLFVGCPLSDHYPVGEHRALRPHCAAARRARGHILPEVARMAEDVPGAVRVLDEPKALVLDPLLHGTVRNPEKSEQKQLQKSERPGGRVRGAHAAGGKSQRI